MIDTDKYEKHTCAPWEWGKEEWSKNALITGKTSLGVTSPHNPTRADALLIADAPLLLAEVKRLRMIVAKLEDARIESTSMYDRPKLFDAVREIYEQRLQDIYQEKREEE